MEVEGKKEEEIQGEGEGKEEGDGREGQYLLRVEQGIEPSDDKQENSAPLKWSRRQRNQAATADSGATKISKGSTCLDEVCKIALFFYSIL